ncbi:MAG: ABC transporter ATP-binding protein [Dehalococcoidia bacterium]|nr:ABC transporter ATP-binding protein [Dehalococcoidia bacterium]
MEGQETIAALKRKVEELERRLATGEDQRENIVVAQKLTKVYGRGTTRVVALKEVDLRVRKGEFIAVQGPSGSGKTTLLNMIGALDRPTEGKVVIDGVETTSVPERRLYQMRRGKLGFIFQTYYLVPTLNALQNVLMPVLPVRGNKRYKKRAMRLLELVGLKDRMHHKPGELSGGEQQRVAIARALMLNPTVILADEPTGNLDTRTGAEIIELMHRLNKEQGKTFIIVTHDRRIAESAERVVYLMDGKLSDIPIEEQ